MSDVGGRDREAGPREGSVPVPCPASLVQWVINERRHANFAWSRGARALGPCVVGPAVRCCWPASMRMRRPSIVTPPSRRRCISRGCRRRSCRSSGSGRATCSPARRPGPWSSIRPGTRRCGRRSGTSIKTGPRPDRPDGQLPAVEAEPRPPPVRPLPPQARAGAAQDRDGEVVVDAWSRTVGPTTTGSAGATSTTPSTSTTHVRPRRAAEPGPALRPGAEHAADRRRHDGLARPQGSAARSEASDGMTARSPVPSSGVRPLMVDWTVAGRRANRRPTGRVRNRDAGRLAGVAMGGPWRPGRRAGDRGRA